MVMEYAIKIEDKYFKSFVYADKNTYGRFTGGATSIGNYQIGDIIDIELTNDVELTETRRSLAERIKLIYDMDKFKDKIISIIPVSE
jgi:glycine cleavage system H lipoate-binding protein